VGDVVTPAQSIALNNPCFLGGETMHPRFRSRINASYSLVLTVNAGYE
jgi:hypothetical protein